MKDKRWSELSILLDLAGEKAFLSYQSFREVHTKYIVWCAVRGVLISLHLGTWTFPWLSVCAAKWVEVMAKPAATFSLIM